MKEELLKQETGVESASEEQVEKIENSEKSLSQDKREKITNLGTQLDVLMNKIAQAKSKLENLPEGEGDAETIREIEELISLLPKETEEAKIMISDSTNEEGGTEQKQNLEIQEDKDSPENILSAEEKEEVHKINEGFAVLEDEFKKALEIFNSNRKYTQEKMTREEKKLAEFTEILETLKKHPKLDTELLFGRNVKEVEGIEKIQKFIKYRVGEPDSYRVYSAIRNLKEWSKEVENELDWDRTDFKTLQERHVDPMMDGISRKSWELYEKFLKMPDGPEREKLLERKDKLEEELENFEEMKSKGLS